MADPKAIFDDEDTPSGNAGVLEAKPACLKCGHIQPTMKCCTRCHSAFYCSRPCFVKHWPVHKQSCQPNHRVQEEETQCEAEATAAREEKTLYRVVYREKPTTFVSNIIDFQKAADELAAAVHDEKEQQDNESDLPGQEILLRYNKQKHRLKIYDAWDAQTVFNKIASFVSCLPDKMRLIHKGKQLSMDTVRSAVSQGAVFQVLGEKMEDAEGLVPKDIEVLMLQMGVERNVAVRALKSSKGDLIDAMMAIGNK